MPVKKKKTVKKKAITKKPAVPTGAEGFKIVDSVISRRNQNGTVMLMSLDKASSFFKLDGIAAEVWTCLESARTAQALVDHFSKLYPAKAKTLSRDIEGLVKKLIKLELLSESEGPFDRAFRPSASRAEKSKDFGSVQEFDLEQIESEVLNESVYLDVFAGSDFQLKTGIAPIRNALEKVLQLDGITHRWNADAVPSRVKVNSKSVHAGLIAQQVAMHMPELVRADKRTGYLAVEYQKLNSYLVEAIKDLNQMMLVQEKRIKSLEKKRASGMGRC